ncbi:MAG TPA: aspartate/glutamate racemase family protein [Streptosporangiaceae bacterium]|nr:aspartate/glutamate racemase family protein [Streptosporangiaceae bacterium]
MPKKVAYLHTVSSLVGLFNDLSRELLPPGTEVFHIADEMLLKTVMAQGGLSPFIYQRVADNVAAAERAGAAVVQCTCSSISPCVEAVRPLVGIPVLKIDDPMVDKALSLGRRIGVAATAPTTLKPTTELVQAKAEAKNVPVKVDSALAEGAFAALSAGDTATHDRLVTETLRTLMRRNDVVLLAQASMARVAAAIPAEEQKVPLLSSPRLAVETLAGVLAKL